MNGWLLLILVIAAAVGWHLLKAKVASVRATVPTRAPTAAGTSDKHWTNNGYFDFEVVGESHYQATLKALAAKGNEFTAQLIPENNNPHDDKAVCVAINGEVVGYLTREDARSFRRRLARAKLGLVTTTCPARLTGGFALKDGGTASIGVELDMKPFE